MLRLNLGAELLWNMYWAVFFISFALSTKALFAIEYDKKELADTNWQSFWSKDDNEQPIQLIRPREGHDRLEVNEMALERLSAISEPLAIVSVVGPYHSGKSFLLNVLLNSSHGFPVGTRPEPETKGIWIRIIPKDKLVAADGSQVALLDTEGFYGDGVSRSYDARIFAIATLLGSHLVYNTLRTLGDAQSVAALADLSKQAQVFNLQNWLHTANVESDKATPMLDINPFLLLKTLDFPSLTWVVQGFDIEIQPSSSPLNYLKKYLAAHASTGDRTLDMLFTKGIDCYTLRTPIDLNALRKQSGGEGLGAKDELFTSLHPDYLSDLNHLRDGLFVNLKAKGEGNFTGKNIARLMPLLVHYVNEDFPVNADRKLRDVLTDIIVDGAFSGGVQFFQLSMQPLSPGDPDERLKILGKVQTSEEYISALVASALTQEQLEDIMKIAENHAIEYCRQRCVGVPQGLVNPTCEGQLGVKIARLKPQYREENVRRVKDVLLRLGEGLRHAALKDIEGLRLPLRETDLKQFCNQAIINASKRYEGLVGPHRGSQLYNAAKEQMREEIQNKCDKVQHMNLDIISGFLHQAKSAYQSSYEKSMKADPSHEIGEGKPIYPKKLVEMNIAATKLAQAAFENEVMKSGLSWVGPGYELYDFHQFQCFQWSKQRSTEIQAQNEVYVKAFSAKLASKLALRYKEEVTCVIPFPDNDEIITAKTDVIAKNVTEEYDSVMKEFGQSTTVEERKKELLHGIEESRAYLLRKNTALMAAFCYDPLMDAYNELQMQDCERTFHNMWFTWSFWSLKCLWPGPRYMFGFKYRAYSVARKHLEKAQSTLKSNPSSSNKGVVLSSATQNKVIHAWIERDLGHYANMVFVNWTMLTTLVVGFLSCIYVVVGFSRDLYNRSKRQSFYGSSHSKRYFQVSPSIHQLHGKRC